MTHRRPSFVTGRTEELEGEAQNLQQKIQASTSMMQHVEERVDESTNLSREAISQVFVCCVLCVVCCVLCVVCYVLCVLCVCIVCVLCGQGVHKQSDRYMEDRHKRRSEFT